jgi:hypothetical protein
MNKKYFHSMKVNILAFMLFLYYFVEYLYSSNAQIYQAWISLHNIN